MRLESCTTIQYILGVRKEILSTEDTRIKSPLQHLFKLMAAVGPIASLGQRGNRGGALSADTDYFYFRLNSEGSMCFQGHTGNTGMRGNR